MSVSKVANLLERNNENSKNWKAPPTLSDLRDRVVKAGGKATIIISCSDPRIPPELYLGLGPNECPIIRNAGGRAQDAIRSILVLDTVVTMGEVIVIHHTDCGMSKHTESEFQNIIGERHPDFVKQHPGIVYGAMTDPEKSVVEDVEFLKSFPSLNEHFKISGLVLDTFTGVMKKIV